MTGKELKEFAARLQDDAIIEMEDDQSYRDKWKKLAPHKLRAVLDLRPEITLDHVANMEDAT